MTLPNSTGTIGAGVKVGRVPTATASTAAFTATMDGTDATFVTVIPTMTPSHTVDVSDIGKLVIITGGTHAKKGAYKIVGTSGSTKWILDRAAATASDGAPAGYLTTTLAEVSDVTPPSGSVSKVRVSNHDSPSLVHEYLASWIDHGDASIDLIYLKAQEATIQTLLYGRTTDAWYMAFPDGSYLTWSGFLTANSPASPLEGAMTQRCGVSVSGTITFQAAD